MAEARDTASPDVVSQFPDPSYNQIRRNLAQGTPPRSRKQGRSEQGRFEETPERQKKLVKLVSWAKNDASSVRPRINKALYYNIYAALCKVPTNKSQRDLRDVGQTMDDLLVFMLERMKLEDGSIFKVENASDVDFIIQQVRSMH